MLENHNSNNIPIKPNVNESETQKAPSDIAKPIQTINTILCTLGDLYEKVFAKAAELTLENERLKETNKKLSDEILNLIFQTFSFYYTSSLPSKGKEDNSELAKRIKKFHSKLNKKKKRKEKKKEIKQPKSLYLTIVYFIQALKVKLWGSD